MSYGLYYDLFRQMGYDDVEAEKRANDLVERDAECVLEQKRRRERDGWEDND